MSQKLSLLIYILFALAIHGAAPVLAQVMPHTVGDGTTFIFSPGRQESYGLTSGNVGSSDMGQPLFERNTRWGNSSGIGTSGLQTQSATADSSPPVAVRTSSTLNSTGLARPDLGRPFGAPVGSPAFGASFNDRLPGFAPLGGSGMFTGSGLTSSYATDGFASGVAGRSSAFGDLDATPSFNRRGGSMLPLSGADDSKLFKSIRPEF